MFCDFEDNGLLPIWEFCSEATRKAAVQEAFEAHADVIFDQAEDRLHFQRTLLAVLMGEGGIG